METSDSIVNDESFLDRLYYLSFVPIATGIEILPAKGILPKGFLRSFGRRHPFSRGDLFEREKFILPKASLSEIFEAWLLKFPVNPVRDEAKDFITLQAEFVKGLIVPSYGIVIQ